MIIDWLQLSMQRDEGKLRPQRKNIVHANFVRQQIKIIPKN